MDESREVVRVFSRSEVLAAIHAKHAAPNAEKYPPRIEVITDLPGGPLQGLRLTYYIEGD